MTHDIIMEKGLTFLKDNESSKTCFTISNILFYSYQFSFNKVLTCIQRQPSKDTIMQKINKRVQNLSAYMLQIILFHASTTIKVALTLYELLSYKESIGNQ